MALSARSAQLAAALGVVLACGAPTAWAQVPRIALLVVDPADPGTAPLLLALQLVFPEAEVEAISVGEGPQAEPPVAATLTVVRTGEGWRVAVYEAGARLIVARDVPAAGGDEESAAHAVALLARSLLGVALLYEPERTAASPELQSIARPSADRAARALVPAKTRRRTRAARSLGGRSGPHGALLALGGTVQGAFEATAPTRAGGRLGLAYRPPIPMEVGVEASLVTTASAVGQRGLDVRHTGVPLGVFLRWRLEVQPVEILPAFGVLVERSTVTASLEGGARRVSFSDTNAALSIEGRVRWPIAGAFGGLLRVDVGLRAVRGFARQNYVYATERVLSVAGFGWTADVGLAALVP